MPKPLTACLAAALTLCAGTAPAFADSSPTLGVTPVPVSAEPLPESLPDMSTLAWRHGQLQLHQGFGLATLAAMAVTAGMGYYQAEVKGSDNLRDAHLLMGGLTTGLYLTTATLALTTPPKQVQYEEGPWSSVNIHKDLAWLHGAGMLATVGLGLVTALTPNNTSRLHEIAAFSTLGLMALSAGVIAFGE